jgi:hypothetical protein
MACAKAWFAAAVSAWPASPPRWVAMPLAAPIESPAEAPTAATSEDGRRGRVPGRRGSVGRGRALADLPDRLLDATGPRVAVSGKHEAGGDVF